MGIRRYIDGNVIRRYIDTAVRREIRRLFRDSILDDLRTLWRIVNQEADNLGQARPSLKILIDMYEHPKGDVTTLMRNKLNFAKIAQKAIDKAKSPNAMAARAVVIIKNIISDIMKENAATTVNKGSNIPTSGANPYRAGEYKQYQLSYNVPSVQKEEYTGPRKSYMVRKNGEITSTGYNPGKKDSLRRTKRYRKFGW